MTETDRATRSMYQTILRRLGLLVGALAVGGAAVGYLVAELPGVWGALMGAGIAALFMVGTVATMALTADKPVPIASAAGMGGWLVKMLLLFGLLVLVQGRNFYSPGVFFVVLVLAVLGSLAIEVTAVLRARVPTVEPQSRTSAADESEQGHGPTRDEGHGRGPRAGS